MRVRYRFQPARVERTATKTRRVSRAARLLALAHHVDRLVEAGELASYAEAARVLGFAKSWGAQIQALLMLAPEIQERVLTGELDVTERRLRRIVGEVEWGRQIADPKPNVHALDVEDLRGSVDALADSLQQSRTRGAI